MNTPARREKLIQVAEELERVLSSVMFRDEILKLTKADKVGELSDWRGMPNLSLYNHITSGADRFDSNKDNVMDVFVDDYYSFKRVIGYTTLNSKYIYVNTKYFDKRSNKLVGSNILHEYGHQLGFSHDFRATSRRPNSICYKLNGIYEKCHDIIIKKGLTWKKVFVRRKWCGMPIYRWVQS